MKYSWTKSKARIRKIVREYSEMEELVCDDCKKSDKTVVQCICPFAEEIYDKKVPAILCSDCYRERCNDI